MGLPSLFVIYFLAAIFASIGGRGYMLDGKPLDSLATVLYQRHINFDFECHITLFKGNAVDLVSLTHTLFGETTATDPLQIVSEISEFLIGGWSRHVMVSACIFPHSH